MKKTSVAELKEIAKDLRKKAVTMIYEAQSGHPGGSLSAADFVTACYFREMNIDPKNRNGKTVTVLSCRKAMSAPSSTQLWGRWASSPKKCFIRCARRAPSCRAIRT